MDAEASAPSRPTMDASIYCIIIEEICEKIAGTLNVIIMRSCWERVNFSPARSLPSSVSLFIFHIS